MENDVTKIKSDDLSWFNSKYGDGEITFIQIYKELYVLFTQVLTEKTCEFCKSKEVVTHLVGKENVPYRLNYCTDCKFGSLEESQEDYNKIPMDVLQLMNQKFILGKEKD